MAEATVSSPLTQRYFCHTCSLRIPRLTEDFTCPTCGGGFVEEVEEEQALNPFSDRQANLFGLPPGVSGTPHPMFPFDMLLRGLPAAGPSHGQRGRQGVGGGSLNVVELRQNPGGGFSMSLGGREGGGIGGGNSGETPMEQMLFSFLNDLMLGLGGQPPGGNPLGAPGMNVFGNLGDYVWGRDGLDAIVTQLMNQMEGSGPPPLPPDKLDLLPTAYVTADQIAKKLQCSVCWEDFALNEEVKQLPCEHVFHSDCILPWLKLHGTCPICRRDFTGFSDEDSQEPPSPTTEPPPSGRNPPVAPSNPDGNARENEENRRNQDSTLRFNIDMDFD